ncbi:MAG: thiamine phosphate synthase [Selenomonadales bacterium]|nr:thiamine phosphate synthase [Selenomonadales bacterium]
MCSVTVVTNRHLCREDFLTRVERVAAGGADRIILREKDLSADEYRRLAEQVLDVCMPYPAECIFHSFAEADYPRVHLPLPVMRNNVRKKHWQTVGVSVHSAEEACEAEAWGADYLVAGHIFATDCKQGLAGRGTDFLIEVCHAVRIPIHAIGGISEKNVHLLSTAGAKGICIMSSAMRENDPEQLIKRLHEGMKMW